MQSIRQQELKTWLLALVLSLGIGGMTQAAAPRLTYESMLPAALPWAFDVRWATNEEIWLAAGTHGVVSWRLDTEKERTSTVVEGGHGRDRFWLSHHLGLSKDRLAVAAIGRSYGWRARSGGELYQVHVDVVVDVDLQADRIAILGATKDGRGQFSSDGAIAWIGEIGEDIDELQAIYYSVTGRGAEPMADCWFLKPGAVRFLADGSLVLAPGVEPGVFWYSADGQLIRTWPSEEFGLPSSPCLDIDARAAMEPSARLAWLNARRVVDDVLPLPEGPALVVREHRDGVTRWNLAALRRDGSWRWGAELPVRSTTGWARLRGDVRGERVVLLVSEHGKEEPVSASRLAIVDWE